MDTKLSRTVVVIGLVLVGAAVATSAGVPPGFLLVLLICPLMMMFMMMGMGGMGHRRDEPSTGRRSESTKSDEREAGRLS